MPKISAILVTGSSGQLGRSLKAIVTNYLEYDFFFATRDDIDLSDSLSISEFFDAHSFDVIINCAAHTAVDKAESEPELTEQVNHLAVRQLADVAKHQRVKLIHISTDYVFDGKQYRPYIETDQVAPQGVYGETKLKGERAVLEVMPDNALIIRTSWVYSEYCNNFVKTMLRYGSERDTLNVIFDQVGTPTYAHDLACVIMALIENDRFKQARFDSDIYHYSNEGVCSWYDFAKAIFKLSDISCDVSPIETKDYPTPASRPHYSLLNKAKIKQHFALTIPYWQDSLQKCLNKLQENAL